MSSITEQDPTLDVSQVREAVQEALPEYRVDLQQTNAGLGLWIGELVDTDLETHQNEAAVFLRAFQGALPEGYEGHLDGVEKGPMGTGNFYLRVTRNDLREPALDVLTGKIYRVIRSILGRVEVGPAPGSDSAILYSVEYEDDYQGQMQANLAQTLFRHLADNPGFGARVLRATASRSQAGLVVDVGTPLHTWKEVAA